MQCACAMLSSVACPALLVQYFLQYLINGAVFGNKVLNMECEFWFSLQLLSETFLIISRTERHVITNIYWSSCTLSVITVRFYGPGSSVGIATGYELNGPGIESRWGRELSAPVQTGPGAHPTSCTMGTGSFPGVKNGRGVTLTPHPLLVSLVMKE